MCAGFADSGAPARTQDACRVDHLEGPSSGCCSCSGCHLPRFQPSPSLLSTGFHFLPTPPPRWCAGWRSCWRWREPRKVRPSGAHGRKTCTLACCTPSGWVCSARVAAQQRSRREEIRRGCAPNCCTQCAVCSDVAPLRRPAPPPHNPHIWHLRLDLIHSPGLPVDLCRRPPDAERAVRRDRNVELGGHTQCR